MFYITTLRLLLLENLILQGEEDVGKIQVTLIIKRFLPHKIPLLVLLPMGRFLIPIINRSALPMRNIRKLSTLLKVIKIFCMKKVS